MEVMIKEIDMNRAGKGGVNKKIVDKSYRKLYTSHYPPPFFCISLIEFHLLRAKVP